MAIRRMTKAEKANEAKVAAAFKKVGSNRQFNIFDLSKIHNAGNDVAKRGGSQDEIDAAVSAACDQYEIKVA